MGGISLSRRRRVTVTLAVLGLLAVLATYVGLTLSAPNPVARALPNDGYERSFAIAEVEIPWPEQPAALGILGNEPVRSNENDAVVPAASLAKLIPVLVSLEKLPFGDEMPTRYPLTQRDVTYQSEGLQIDAATTRVIAGTTQSRYEMLQQILLASSSNSALSYRDWMFGDQAAFVAETEQWLAKHGLSSMVMREVTGLDPEQTRSNASDFVRVAQLALAQPVIAEIAAQPSATLENVGVLKNTNPLLGESGVRGLKTGSIVDAQGTEYRNIIVARDVTVAGRALTVIVVALAQPNPQARLEVARQLLNSIDANIQQIEVAQKGETVGTVTAWNGQAYDLVTADGASTVLTLDESADRTVRVQPLPAGTEAGATVGQVVIKTPTGEQRVEVVLTESIPEPDAWWRLTHPFEVWGWR